MEFTLWVCLKADNPVTNIVKIKPVVFSSYQKQQQVICSIGCIHTIMLKSEVAQYFHNIQRSAVMIMEWCAK